MADRDWQDWYAENDPDRVICGSLLKVDPVFSGEVSLEPPDGQGVRSWRARLNGQKLSAYRNMAHAKGRVDWEIWNRLRQIREPYKRVLERRGTWETAWQ
jgi:hypothetical protein